MPETEKEQSLLKKSAKGMKWSMMASIFNMSLQIGYTSVMAYLLDSVTFGIMAIASVVVDFGRHVTNMGIRQAIVQKQNLNSDDIRAAFSFSLGLGSLIYLIIFLVADYVVWIYKKLVIVFILKWLWISFIFASILILSQNLLRRRVQFKPCKYHWFRELYNCYKLPNSHFELYDQIYDDPNNLVRYFYFFSFNV
jgi:O-antigen/teichoic acid export membrane protein